jgi:two-component system sensor histidine kinase FlrB
MTSLPIALPEPAVAAAVFGEDEKVLLQAFRSFAETADSLERSYAMLRSEVARLRGELAASHAGLERSLEENREMRQHLDRVLDGLPCGVLVVKADGSISRINPEGRRLLRSLTEGGPSVSTFESPSVDSPSFESLVKLPGELRDLLDRTRSVWGEQEQCFPGESGSERWLAARHAPVEAAEPGKRKNKNKDDGDRESIFTLRDVSDAKKLIHERERNRREQALAEMSAVLAHEIRNPLGSLELFAGLLASSALSAQCRGWVEHVQAGLRTLAATVNNVLHFHSLPAPEGVLTDLGALLDWAEGFLAPMARQAGVELSVTTRLQGVLLPADRHRLEQVLLNLVLNAFRAMPGGGRVEVAGVMLREGDLVGPEICVSDTGLGLPMESVEKIFEPGFSTRAGSPGLGLAVCRKIVEQHGGTLRAENQAGGGACFTLRFALGAPAPPYAQNEVAREIPFGKFRAGSRPAGENAGLRNDAVG